jgi:hypothetical protein
MVAVVSTDEIEAVAVAVLPLKVIVATCADFTTPARHSTAQ